ncbi:hypothetical protein XENOCAPTIV_024467 [Xenoophorus captivus]|uniref:Secreted protein n=1 Tax=Xenoophorus captivus TaxID=1517983 RepID=A0ABV0SDA8_9TELE
MMFFEGVVAWEGKKESLSHLFCMLWLQRFFLFFYSCVEPAMGFKMRLWLVFCVPCSKIVARPCSLVLSLECHSSGDSQHSSSRVSESVQQVTPMRTS